MKRCHYNIHPTLVLRPSVLRNFALTLLANLHYFLICVLIFGLTPFLSTNATMTHQAGEVRWRKGKQREKERKNERNKKEKDTKMNDRSSNFNGNNTHGLWVTM